MELLIITAVRDFEKEIKVLLKKSGVKTFSYMDVIGYKDQSDQPIEANWFASNIGESQAVLFYAFVPETLIDQIMAHIFKLNTEQESLSRIHVATMDVKRINNQ